MRYFKLEETRVKERVKRLALKHPFFRRKIVKAWIHDPVSNFKLKSHPIEYRINLHTGYSCRINVRRLERPKQAPEEEESLKKIINNSRKGCLFCPENVEEKTPFFPDNLIPEGRLKKGESILFPNLYPFSEYHAVAVFSGEHNLIPADFSLDNIKNCLGLAFDFMKIVHQKNPQVMFGSVNWNHLPPAGASIIHPHLQIQLDREPVRTIKELLEMSEAYHKERGSSYWNDLIEVEKNVGERVIAEDSSLTWLANFAPWGNNEILGVFKDASSISQLSTHNIEDLSRGISNIIKGYRSMGIESFNIGINSGPFNKDLNYYALNLKLISRPQLQPFYTGDRGFMEILHREIIVESSPERLTQKIKPFFT